MLHAIKKMLSCAPVFLAMSTLALSLTACEQEGPAERAGEKIDEAIEETKEEAREAKEKLEEAYKKKTE